jgi:hypothetical protein
MHNKHSWAKTRIDKSLPNSLLATGINPETLTDVSSILQVSFNSASFLYENRGFVC